MLTIAIPGAEDFNEATQEFIYHKEQTLVLEHSLVSLSKWESKWCKPFISDDPMSWEETLDYIRCMTITKNIGPEVYERLTMENVKAIEEYINAPMTASTVNEKKSRKGGGNERVTSELIYYWMTALNIPFECEKWHLNRLMMLIKIANIKNSPSKKMGRSEVLKQNAALNEARLKKLNTRG